MAGLDEHIDIHHVPRKFNKNDAAPHTAGKDKNSPIRVALKLHREGKFDAVVSAGSTGAQVVATLTELGACQWVNRPAIGSLFPTVKGFSLLLDIGATLVAGPRHLAQFAAMGHLYSKEMMGLEHPRIGLLNVGKEADVGPPAIKMAHKILNQSKFNYIGFIEGYDVLAGAADVIVTNGFVGNIMLKYTEGVREFVNKFLPADSDENIGKLINDRLDYQNYGGEPLLGINGVSVISHGSSTALAICSAIMKAYQMAEAGFHAKFDSFMQYELGSFIAPSLMRNSG